MYSLEEIELELLSIHNLYGIPLKKIRTILEDMDYYEENDLVYVPYDEEEKSIVKVVKRIKKYNQSNTLIFMAINLLIDGNETYKLNLEKEVK